MKKIDKESAQAFFTGKPFKKGNTVVIINERFVGLTLHGHMIAKRIPGENHISLSNAGWQTVTTKSRLNAILSMYGATRIWQTNFEWSLHPCPGGTPTPFPTDEFYEVKI